MQLFIFLHDLYLSIQILMNAKMGLVDVNTFATILLVVLTVLVILGTH